MTQQVWLAIDRDNTEWVFLDKPKYSELGILIKPEKRCQKFPKGSFERILGRELTWIDKPVEYKLK